MIDAPKWMITHLQLENFRQLKSFELAFSSNVTLLIGVNGSGKSTVLDAVSIMLSTIVSQFGGEGKAFVQSDARRVLSDVGSTRRLATDEAQYPVVGSMSGVLNGHNFAWDRRLGSGTGRTTRGDKGLRDFIDHIRVEATRGTGREDETNILPVFAYYGVERLTGTRRGQGEIPASRTGAYVSALDPRSDLTRLGAFFESLDGQILAARAYDDPAPAAAIEQFRAIDSACSSMLRPTEWGGLRWNRALDTLTLSHPERGSLPLSSLASGTKIAAGLAIDLASRMARANSHLGAHALLAETPGVVLIDEVDLHLHPTWQQEIVPALRRTFPSVQFILSTHSPQVIATVESENIRILDGENVTVPRYANGLRPEAILSEVQNTNPVPAVPARRDLDRYLEAVYSDNGLTPEFVDLRKKLDSTLGGASLNPELLEADAYLTFSSLGEE